MKKNSEPLARSFSNLQTSPKALICFLGLVCYFWWMLIRRRAGDRSFVQKKAALAAARIVNVIGRLFAAA